MPENATQAAEDEADIIDMTAHIVSSYLSNNHVATGDIPDLIRSVHAALRGTSGAPAAKELQPAVAVRQSVKPEYIVCLEDGRKLKMLKRHLATAYGMTPDEYRQKWQLPAD